MGAISVSGIMITAVAWLSSSLASLFFIAGGTAGAAKVRETLASEGWGRKAGLLFLGCALLSIYAAWLFGTGYDMLCYMALLTYLLSILPEDVRQKEIADGTTICFGILFLVLRICAWDIYQLIDAGAGFLAGLVLLGLPYLMKRSWIGLGDIKAAACCGIILGLVGVVQFIIRALIAVTLYSIIQLIRKKLTLQSELPFVPFMLVAALI